MAKHLTWFTSRGEGLWQCTLCPHQCVLREGGTGRCRVRGIRDGSPVDLGFGQLSAAQVDPIEKKPLFHFCPGSRTFSIGGYGCNFRCDFCQNWHIAQCRRQAPRAWRPDEVIKAAQQQDCPSIAYTYNEPIIGHPFLLQTAILARRHGLSNLLVTNGYIQPEPACELLRMMDAINLDIKSMQERFYRTQCGGHLAPVLAFARQAFASGVHLEITNLLITGRNDDPDETEALAQWIARHLSPETVLHLTAYHPAFALQLPATTPDTVRQACAIARKHLRYVYSGNIPEPDGMQHTDCPHCGTRLISRTPGKIRCSGLQADGSCRSCGFKTNVIQETPRDATSGPPAAPPPPRP